MAWTKHRQLEVLINYVGYVCSAMETTFKEDEWDDYEINGDHLVACISLGDNFAISIEEENKEGTYFYILLCTQTSFLLDQPFTC